MIIQVSKERREFRDELSYDALMQCAEIYGSATVKGLTAENPHSSPFVPAYDFRNKLDDDMSPLEEGFYCSSELLYDYDWHNNQY